MNIRETFFAELIKQGLSEDRAERIADRLSPSIESIVNKYEGRYNMVSRLSGSVTAAAVQKRVMVTVPQSQAYGVYSKAESVIRLHPDWTEDQVTAEVLKAFTPASAGGQLILPQSYVDLQARKTMLAVGAVVLLVGVVILSSRKRRRA